MKPLLNQQTAFFFDKLGLKIIAMEPDLLASDYDGLTIKLENGILKYRKAKVTPKKNGLFVTLWKRNLAGISIPYHTNDDFDCCIIEVEFEKQVGFFFFSKNLLVEQAIVSTHTKEGKRGFRVYPDWDIPQSLQAKKTQTWQCGYFIKVAHTNETNLLKISQLLAPLN